MTTVSMDRQCCNCCVICVGLNQKAPFVKQPKAYGSLRGQKNNHLPASSGWGGACAKNGRLAYEAHAPSIYRLILTKRGSRMYALARAGPTR